MRMELTESYKETNGVSVPLDYAGTRSVIADAFGVEDL